VTNDPEEAVADAARLLQEAKAKRSPDRSATVAHLLDKWMEIADHELSTVVTNRGYIEQKLKPTIGGYTVRQFQDRVDVLDEEEMERQGMRALLGVAAGSARSNRRTKLRHKMFSTSGSL